MEKKDKSLNLLKMAYKCKAADLESLLEKIELIIENSENTDKNLLRAKTIVTSKLAVYRK